MARVSLIFGTSSFLEAYVSVHDGGQDCRILCDQEDGLQWEFEATTGSGPEEHNSTHPLPICSIRTTCNCRCTLPMQDDDRMTLENWTDLTLWIPPNPQDEERDRIRWLISLEVQRVTDAFEDALHSMSKFYEARLWAHEDQMRSLKKNQTSQAQFFWAALFFLFSLNALSLYRLYLGRPPVLAPATGRDSALPSRNPPACGTTLHMERNNNINNAPEGYPPSSSTSTSRTSRAVDPDLLHYSEQPTRRSRSLSLGRVYDKSFVAIPAQVHPANLDGQEPHNLNGALRVAPPVGDQMQGDPGPFFGVSRDDPRPMPAVTSDVPTGTRVEETTPSTAPADFGPSASSIPISRTPSPSLLDGPLPRSVVVADDHLRPRPDRSAAQSNSPRLVNGFVTPTIGLDFSRWTSGTELDGPSTSTSTRVPVGLGLRGVQDFIDDTNSARPGLALSVPSNSEAVGNHEDNSLVDLNGRPLGPAESKSASSTCDNRDKYHAGMDSYVDGATSAACHSLASLTSPDVINGHPTTPEMLNFSIPGNSDVAVPPLAIQATGILCTSAVVDGVGTKNEQESGHDVQELPDVIPLPTQCTPPPSPTPCAIGEVSDDELRLGREEPTCRKNDDSHDRTGPTHYQPHPNINDISVTVVSGNSSSTGKEPFTEPMPTSMSQFDIYSPTTSTLPRQVPFKPSLSNNLLGMMDSSPNEGSSSQSNSEQPRSAEAGGIEAGAGVLADR
ncbi:hypothetical protein DXG01_011989 [Tephrocybe rancida]|nr:hypothetical protein DXG01_011989 [Tephrocybe rancida]